MNQQNRPFAKRLIGLLCTVCTAFGCGSPKVVKINGEVTVNGKPAAFAAVNFTPIGKGRPASGIADESGRFTVGSFAVDDGLVPGEYKITVTQGEDVSGDFKAEPLEQMIANAGKPPANPTSRLHPKYASVETTPLKATVPPGRIVLELTADGR